MPVDKTRYVSGAAGMHIGLIVPLHRLAQVMGHDSLDTMLRYVRDAQQDLQQAVETIAWA